MVITEVASEQEKMDVDPPLGPLEAPTSLKAPSLSTRVFKDECMYCFHTPYFPGGIYVCLEHFVGLCANHVHAYYESNGCRLYLHSQKKRTKRVEPETSSPSKTLTIVPDRFDESELNTVIVAPQFEAEITINEQTLDAHLYHIVQAVLRHSSATQQDQLTAGVSDWDGTERKELPNAEHLVQMDIDKKIPESGWVCEEPNCNLTENLWLNLSDGTILCGRYQYMPDGTMSKGNSHAKFHAKATGFLVLVKLGTIQNGDADVFSYAEEDAVWDPYLRKHLEHFGLDMERMEKTEKSTLELELDLNQKWEWSRCQEDGVTLENMYGSGFSGLINIGSSCYINSVLQMLLLNPAFVEAYMRQWKTSASGQQLAEHHEDFNFQLMKVVTSLLSGEYAKPDFEFNGIKPSQFRRVTGRGHGEFSTARQQDAEEYIRYLFNKIEDSLPGDSPIDDFRFKVVTRFMDLASGKLRYEENEDVLLSLPIPKQRLRDEPTADGDKSGSGSVTKPPRKSIELNTLIESFASVNMIEGFVSPITNEPKGAHQSLMLGTFPKFLLIQVRRYAHDDNYMPQKLDVDVIVPEELNLEKLRFGGRKPDDDMLPESVEAPTGAASKKSERPQVNDQYVKALLEMGFEQRQAETAVFMSKNESADAAAEWLFTHLDDPDFDTYHPDVQLAASTSIAETIKKREKRFFDGPAQYTLRGFITHMGSSPHSGHYVCHLRRDGVWYLYNDEKVAVSQNPPKSLGYIYLYEQKNI